MFLYVMFFGLFWVSGPSPDIPLAKYSLPQLMSQTECESLASEIAARLQAAANKRFQGKVQIRFACVRQGWAL